MHSTTTASTPQPTSIHLIRRRLHRLHIRRDTPGSTPRPHHNALPKLVLAQRPARIPTHSQQIARRSPQRQPTTAHRALRKHQRRSRGRRRRHVAVVAGAERVRVVGEQAAGGEREARRGLVARVGGAQAQRGRLRRVVEGRRAHVGQARGVAGGGGGAGRYEVEGAGGWCGAVRAGGRAVLEGCAGGEVQEGQSGEEEREREHGERLVGGVDAK